MVHPAHSISTQPNITRRVPWLQNIALVFIFFAGVITFAVWFSTLPARSMSTVNEPRLELSLSGAIGTNLVLDAEETARTLSCEQNAIRFFQAPTELYGLSWTFTVPQTLDRASVFTLGSTHPLTLSLVSDAGAYRTFTATEGELSFDPESKRGYFTAFLYDENGERVFASSAWQCK
jgi:hypothetical protein